MDTLSIMILAIGGVGIVTFLPYTWAAEIDCNGVKCYGTAGNDLMKGQLGDDQMHGFGGNDIISGKDGNDWMVGYEGDDVIFGDMGNDKIRGSQGNDQLWGSVGNDIIYGEDGNDMIGGSSEADRLIGGRGADQIYGDWGDDIIWHSYNTPNYDPTLSDGSKDIIHCGDGYDIVYWSSVDRDVVMADCEVKIDHMPHGPSGQPPGSGGSEACDRSGMPGCP